MAAGRIILPQMPARDSNGDPVSGALMYFRENGTTTPKTVYTTAALTVPHTNPVVADSSGVFASIFAERGTDDDPTLYSVLVLSPEGVQLPSASYSDVRASIAVASAGLPAVSEFGAGLVGAEDELDAADALGLDDRVYVYGSTVAALEAAAAVASTRGVPLVLGPAYTVGETIDLAADIEIIGNGTVFTVTDPLIHLFTSTADNVTIRGVEVSGCRGVLHQTAAFETITVEDCDFEGVAQSVDNKAVFLADSIAGTTVTVRNNRFQKCTPVYADNVSCDDLNFDDNVVTDGVRHIVRALSSVDDPDSVTAKSPTRISFKRNKVRGINTAMTDKTATARVLQADAKDSIVFDDNDVYHLNTTGVGTGTVVYWGYGSLQFSNNRIARVEGGSTATGKRLISDKSLVDRSTRYFHKAWGNTFDQSEVALAEVAGVTGGTPDAIYHITAVSNFESDNDTFIGCRCPTHRVYQSEDQGFAPKNFAFTNAKIYDHKYPTVVMLREQSKNTKIAGFEVFKQTNPDAVSVNNDARLRLFDCYMSFSNGLHLEDVVVQDNVIHEATSTTDEVIGLLYRNAAAATSEVKNIRVVGNTHLTSTAALRLVTGLDIGRVDLVGNVCATSTISITGTVTADLRVSSHYPPLQGSNSWDPSSIAAGATATRSVTVTGAALGDYVRVSLAASTGGLTLSGYVSAANTVTAVLSNNTGGAIDPAATTVYARVEPRTP